MDCYFCKIPLQEIGLDLPYYVYGTCKKCYILHEFEEDAKLVGLEIANLGNHYKYINYGFLIDITSDTLFIKNNYKVMYKCIYSTTSINNIESLIRYIELIIRNKAFI